MTREMLVEELTLFWQKLVYLFGKMTEMVRGLRVDPGSVSKGDLAMMLATAAVILLFVLGGILRFLKAPWKKKPGMLLQTLLVILVVAVILFFALRGVKLPEGQTGAAETAQTVVIDGEELEVSSQYGLTVGVLSDAFGVTYCEWVLTDDNAAIRMEDGILLRVSDLKGMPGKKGFSVLGLEPGYVFLNRNISSRAAGVNSISDYIDIQVLPDARLADTPWHGQAGEELFDGIERYLVLEGDEERCSFLVFSEGWTQDDGKILVGLSEARQLGQDVVRVTVTSRVGTSAWTGFEFLFHDPRENEEQQARMQELIDALFDGGHLQLLRGLSEEEYEALLPDRVVDVPGSSASGNGGFSIPCTRLIGMARDGLHYYLEWIGNNSEGEAVRYILHNDGPAYDDGENEPFMSWKTAYEAGKKTPDEAMSAFIGCPAVAFEDGWLIQPGKIYLNRTNSMADNYYYLTVEPEA